MHESALHLLQTAEIALPMLAVLFLETTTPVLALALVEFARTVAARRRGDAPPGP